jgi:Family of unknown function (DUF6365)
VSTLPRQPRQWDNLTALLVTPMAVSSGEAITAATVAAAVQARGGTACFLAAPFAWEFVSRIVDADMLELTDDGDENRARWETALRTWRPDVVVFADYPLLFLSSGAAPIADREGWVASLAALDATLVTLDHLGYAQRPLELAFGPPHLSLQSEALPALPPGMHILLPCPLNEPGRVPGRRGLPFRCLDPPLRVSNERRAAVRARYLDDPAHDVLVFHSVPTWSLRFVEAYQLPHYRLLSRLLSHYLSELRTRATVVSVNATGLLTQPDQGHVRFVNEDRLSAGAYDALLLSSDLVLTENAVANTLGKAVCGFVPAAVQRNSYRLGEILDHVDGPVRDLALALEAERPGGIFPHDVFPIWAREDLDRLGLFRDNTIADAVVDLELWGGEATASTLVGLLLDGAERERVVAAQQRYVRRLSALPDAYEALIVLLRGRSGLVG